MYRKARHKLARLGIGRASAGHWHGTGRAQARHAYTGQAGHMPAAGSCKEYVVN